MTIDGLVNYLHKNFGKGEIQKFMKYNRFVHEPYRIDKLIRDVDKVNELYFNIKKTLKNKIITTASGSIKQGDFRNTYGCYDVIVVRNSANNVLRGIIITVLIRNEVWVFKCGRLTNNEKNTMTGTKAYAILKEELEKDGIDITSYVEEDGRKYKEQIDKYPIVNYYTKKELDHVNHIDLVHAWPSALCRKHPEFTKTFKRLDKSVLNSALGYCQSKYIDYKLSKLSMIGINDTNELIYEMTRKMIMEDFVIVGYNTDGIWYMDGKNQNRLYHDEKEGSNMFEWKHDYIDVKFYANSDGQYYIMKDGKYEFKLRGYYQYETIKPREQWTDKQDFFKAIASSVYVVFDEEKGLIIRSLKL